MKTLLAIGMLAFVAPLAGGETRLGTGVTLKDSTPIKSILEQPATYVGKTIRIDGVATAVCAHMGCWMAVARCRQMERSRRSAGPEIQETPRRNMPRMTRKRRSPIN